MEKVKVVLHQRGGSILKGYTQDFFPNKPLFHFTSVDALSGSEAREILVKDLKAIFFVKDFGGDPAYRERRRFEEHEKPHGRKVEVTLIDGEVMAGTTVGYDPHRQGFFVYPVDSQGNNLRVFVVSASVSHFRYL